MGIADCNKIKDLAKVTLVISRVDGEGGSICGPAGPVPYSWTFTVAILMGLVLWEIGDRTNQVARAGAHVSSVWDEGQI